MLVLSGFGIHSEPVSIVWLLFSSVAQTIVSQKIIYSKALAKIVLKIDVRSTCSSTYIFIQNE